MHTLKMILILANLKTEYWDELINNLKENGYNGPITLEIHHQDRYTNMPLEDFYKRGYELALKIKEMFEKEL